MLSPTLRVADEKKQWVIGIPICLFRHQLDPDLKFIIFETFRSLKIGTLLPSKKRVVETFFNFEMIAKR